MSYGGYQRWQSPEDIAEERRREEAEAALQERLESISSTCPDCRGSGERVVADPPVVFFARCSHPKLRALVAG